MKLLYAGTPALAATALAALLGSSHQVCAVYTQPDRPAGRGRHLQASPVKTLALAHSLPVHQPVTLRNKAVQEELQAYQADAMIVAAYGLLLPVAVLNAPRLGCINIHASLLPRWRGAAPIQRAILAGDQETGVCLMQMERGLDTGPVLWRRSCSIHPTDTASTLHDRLAALGAVALLEGLAALEQGALSATPQEEGLACYAVKLDKAEAWLDWRQPATVLDRQIRAFDPYPVAQIQLNDRVIRVWGAIPEPGGEAIAPGTVISANRDGLRVATGEGVLNLQRVQLPGGRPLAIAELLNAHARLFPIGQPLGVVS